MAELRSSPCHFKLGTIYDLLFCSSSLHFSESIFNAEFYCSVLCAVLRVDNSCLLGTGTIEGKFDCGYIVSVKLGSEVLKGVLYHPEQQLVPGSPSVLQHDSAIVPFDRKSRRSSRRRRRNKRKWDPNYPKPNRSGYNFFFAEKHYKLKELYPNREREFTKMIGQSWNSLSPEERMVIKGVICFFLLLLLLLLLS